MVPRPGDARLDDIHGLKPFMIFAPDLRIVGLILAALLALALLLRWWLRRRRPLAAPVLGPAVVAAPVAARSTLKQLDDLAARKLVEGNRPREFHAALSAVVRAYLGARFALPARRLTTTELLGALGGRQLEPRVARQLHELLIGCDLAKFAESRPGAAEMEARLATAREVVEALGDLVVPADEDVAS